MSVVFRRARIDDVEAIVPLIQLAAGGISEFLLNGIISGMSSTQILEMALLDEKTPYFYDNILVAEENNQIVAAGNYYPAEQHALPEIMQQMIPQDKLAIMGPYLTSYVPRSLYIHTLSVLPNYRIRTVGFALCRQIETLAKESGYRSLSAHVWKDNTFVYQGLKLVGFKLVQEVPIAAHPELPHQGGMALLKGPDF